MARPYTNDSTLVQAEFPNNVMTIRERRNRADDYDPVEDAFTVPGVANEYMVSLGYGILVQTDLTVMDVTSGQELTPVPFEQAPGAAQVAVKFDGGLLKFHSSLGPVGETPGHSVEVLYTPLGSVIDSDEEHRIQKEIVAAQTIAHVQNTDTGTTAVNFNLGSGTDCEYTDVGLFFGNDATNTRPSLVYSNNESGDGRFNFSTDAYAPNLRAQYLFGNGANITGINAANVSGIFGLITSSGTSGTTVGNSLTAALSAATGTSKCHLLASSTSGGAVSDLIGLHVSALSASGGTQTTTYGMVIDSPACGTTRHGLHIVAPTGGTTNYGLRIMAQTNNNYAAFLQGTVHIDNYGGAGNDYNGGLIIKGSRGLCCGSNSFPGYGAIACGSNLVFGATASHGGITAPSGIARSAYLASGLTDHTNGAISIMPGYDIGRGGGSGCRDINVTVGGYGLGANNAQGVYLKIFSGGNSPTELQLSAPGTSGGGNQLVTPARLINGTTGPSLTSARDVVQLVIKGHSTQTNNLQCWRNSADALLAFVSGTGVIQAAGYKASDGQIGGTGTVSFRDGDFNQWELTFKDGLFISGGIV